MKQQPMTLPTILDQVKRILESQSDRLPSHSLSRTKHEHGTGIRAETGQGQANHNVPTILPQNIPPLPREALTLPSTSTSAGSSATDGNHSNTDADDNNGSLNALTTLLTAHILPNLNLSSLSPRYFGFITGGATPAALLADILASIYDQNLSVHLPAETISTAIEVATLNLLVDLFHLPRQIWGVGMPEGDGSGSGNAGGVITTGATASNVLGLALGREFVLGYWSKARTGEEVSVGAHGILRASRAAGIDDIVIVSSMPHSSVCKAAGILGLGRDSFVSIARGQAQNSNNSDNNNKTSDPLSIDVDLLAKVVDKTTAQRERKAYILSISTGEVNTGLFATHGRAEWERIRQICDDNGVWIHVDAAFGLFGRVLMKPTTPFSPDDQQLPNQDQDQDQDQDEYTEITRGVEGIEFADSITGDAHKLLNVPYDSGLFFTRHKKLSERVFTNGNAAYLTAATGGILHSIQSPMNIGIENSRRFRALPIYATLMAYGRDGYVDMLKRQIAMTRRVVGWLWDRQGQGVRVLPRWGSKEEALRRTFMIALFALEDEEANKSLVRRINETGEMYVTGTAWEGRPAARLAVSNWQIDVERDGRAVEDVLHSVL